MNAVVRSPGDGVGHTVVGVTVLGHDPLYVRVSDRLGARHLEVSSATWAILGRTGQWRENKHFLDRTVARGDLVVLSHPPALAKPRSAFDRELRYLRSRGIAVNRYQDVHFLL